MTSHDGYGERWFDQEAGPVVRPYAVTKGRTESATAFGLIDVVMATGERPPEQFRPGPEHRRILGVCRRPVPVVDLTSEIDLPLGVVRVLLGDLEDEVIEAGGRLRPRGRRLLHQGRRALTVGRGAATPAGRA